MTQAYSNYNVMGKVDCMRSRDVTFSDLGNETGIVIMENVYIMCRADVTLSRCVTI